MSRFSLVVSALLALALSYAPSALAQEPEHAPSASAHAPSASAHAPEAAPPAQGDPKPGSKPEPKPDPKAEVNDVHDRKPRKMKVGLQLQRVTKLEIGNGTFEADFTISFRCAKEPCDPKLDLYNGEVKGKPDLLVDDPLHKLFRVKAEMAVDFDLTRFPFDEQFLVIDLGDQDALDVTYEIDKDFLPSPKDVKVAGWELQEALASLVDEDLGDGLKVQHFVYDAKMKRPSVSTFAKNFLPPLTMIFVLLVSLVMKPKMAAPRLAAGTGSFVGVIMFHNTAANQLPPLGILTTLDRFMFGLYFIWILHIAFSIGILRSDEQKNEKAGETLYKVAFGVIPTLSFVLALLTFLKVL